MSNVKLDSRVKFPNGKQKKFLEEALSVIELPELANIASVSNRTLRDWKREKYNINFSSLKKICEKRKTDIPRNVKILPKYWSVKKASRLGGRRYIELYGPPGTSESRRKGGLTSQMKFHSNPKIAIKRALISRKKITYPKKSSDLAEFIGIMLGDGGMRGKYQISISFNQKEDLEYARYIQRLITKLFGISSTVKIRQKYGSGDIIVSSKNLVEFLIRHGIKKGNKVTGKIDIPRWIWMSEKYKVACLRGLVDTDGGLYCHKYIANGKKYAYLKMCFTSYSPPLLKSVTSILNDLGLRPKRTAKNRVYLYSLDRLHRYFKKVGTSNPRYFDMYNNFAGTC